MLEFKPRASCKLDRLIAHWATTPAQDRCFVLFCVLSPEFLDEAAAFQTSNPFALGHLEVKFWISALALSSISSGGVLKFLSVSSIPAVQAHLLALQCSDIASQKMPLLPMVACDVNGVKGSVHLSKDFHWSGVPKPRSLWERLLGERFPSYCATQYPLFTFEETETWNSRKQGNKKKCKDFQSFSWTSQWNPSLSWPQHIVSGPQLCVSSPDC